MFKSKSFYIGGVVLGLCLVAFGLFLHYYIGEEFKAVAGVCLGVGCGTAAACASNLQMKRREEKDPQLMKQNKINYEDERNAFIRSKAKAKAADISQWFVMGTAFVNILTDGELWLTLLIIGVYVLHYLTSLYFHTKYSREF